jgi:hypothetical protein
MSEFKCGDMVVSTNSSCAGPNVTGVIVGFQDQFGLPEFSREDTGNAVLVLFPTGVWFSERGNIELAPDRSGARSVLFPQMKTVWG